MTTEADWERFREYQKSRFDPELVRKTVGEFLGQTGRAIGIYPPGVANNPEAVLWVAGETLRTPASPNRPFRTIERMVEYMADIDQQLVFHHLAGGRVFHPEYEVLVKVRERIMETIESGTPNPANIDEVKAFVGLYDVICSQEFKEGRSIIERMIRRRKYGEAAEYHILSAMTPQQQIDYIKGQLPKLKEYKAKNSK